MKPHKPSEKTRNEVRTLAGFGARDEDIATYLGITRPTLYKYYKDELKLGSVQANAAIAETLYRIAKAGNPSACMFWLKTRAGWRETQKVELSGDSEHPVEIKHNYDLSKLSKEELLEMRSMLLKAKCDEKNSPQ